MPRPTSTSTSTSTCGDAPPRRGGRSLDPARSDAIRAAVLEGLAEVGYEALTMDVVAARCHAGKGALYRRWPSKAALVIDAVAHARPVPVDPDRGSLEADLEALVDQVGAGGRLEMPVMLSLLAASLHDAELAEALRTGFIAPRRRQIRTVLRRARARGEIDPEVDLEMVVDLVPALVMHRAVTRSTPPDRAFLRRVIRTVVLPALRPGR